MCVYRPTRAERAPTMFGLLTNGSPNIRTPFSQRLSTMAAYSGQCLQLSATQRSTTFKDQGLQRSTPSVINAFSDQSLQRSTPSTIRAFSDQRLQRSTAFNDQRLQRSTNTTNSVRYKDHRTYNIMCVQKLCNEMQIDPKKKCAELDLDDCAVRHRIMSVQDDCDGTITHKAIAN